MKKLVQKRIMILLQESSLYEIKSRKNKQTNITSDSERREVVFGFSFYLFLVVAVIISLSGYKAVHWQYCANIADNSSSLPLLLEQQADAFPLTAYLSLWSTACQLLHPVLSPTSTLTSILCFRTNTRLNKRDGSNKNPGCW